MSLSCGAEGMSGDAAWPSVLGPYVAGSPWRVVKSSIQPMRFTKARTDLPAIVRGKLKLVGVLLVDLYRAAPVTLPRDIVSLFENKQRAPLGFLDTDFSTFPIDYNIIERADEWATIFVLF
jgi:hypothetical protein